jgi:GT2 family glycosyltransferase
MHGPISIIIPTYNRISTLKQVIRSYTIQKQVREILVVDDASTDTTKEFITTLKELDNRVMSITNTRRQGSPAARNVGVKHSSGDFILFGEDDLRLAPDYTEKLLLSLKENDCSIVAGRILYPLPGETDAEVLSRTSKKIVQRIDKFRIMYDASSPAPGDIEAPFIHSISLIKREVFDDVHFDEDYAGNAYREETDFYLRARRLGHRIFYSPHALCFHLPREVRKLGGNMSQGIWMHKYWALKNNYRFLKKHYSYLKQERLVTHGLGTLMLLFALYELPKIITFYLRRYCPSLYVTLVKHLQNSRQ